MRWKSVLGVAAGAAVAGSLAVAPAQGATVRHSFVYPSVVSISVAHQKPQTVSASGSSYVKVSAAVVPGSAGWCQTAWWRYDSDSGWNYLGIYGKTGFSDYLDRNTWYQYQAAAIDCSGNEGDSYYSSEFYRYLQDSTHLTYSAGWTNVAKSQAYAGSYRQASGIGRTASYYECFYGFAPIVTTQPGGAKIDVLINGVKKGTINTASGAVQYRRLLAGYGSGSPDSAICATVTLRVASAGKAGVDAILFYRD